MMFCDRLAIDPRPGRDRLELPFWLLPNDIRSHRVIHDQPAKTCHRRRIQLRVGSLGSAIDKFHGRFWPSSLSISMASKPELMRVFRISCSYYIFILDLTAGLNRLGKDNCKTRRESFKFCDLVRLILKTLRYPPSHFIGLFYIEIHMCLSYSIF